MHSLKLHSIFLKFLTTVYLVALTLSLFAALELRQRIASQDLQLKILAYQRPPTKAIYKGFKLRKAIFKDFILVIEQLITILVLAQLISMEEGLITHSHFFPIRTFIIGS